VNSAAVAAGRGDTPLMGGMTVARLEEMGAVGVLPIDEAVAVWNGFGGTTWGVGGRLQTDREFGGDEKGRSGGGLDSGNGLSALGCREALAV